nr:juvenile hormone acid O-methyltransferase-like isoform X2 [Onthophagus taurus]
MFNPVTFSENNYNTVIQANSFLANYKDYFKWFDNEIMLDIGCSNGRVTKESLYLFVMPHLKHLIGADISQHAIDVANETYKTSTLSFQVMDIIDSEQCEKDLEKFHHIFAFYLFHLLPRSDLWSVNIYKMLKPKGQLFTSIIVDPRNIINICMADQRNDETKPWSKYIKNVPDIFFDFGPNPKETISDILKKAGFIIDVMDVQYVSFSFPEVHLLRNTLVGGDHFLNHIPMELRDEYIEDFVGKFISQAKSEDGKYSYSFDVLTVVATKP